MEENKLVQNDTEVKADAPVGNKVDEVEKRAEAKMKALHEKLMEDQKKAEAQARDELAHQKAELEQAHKELEQLRTAAREETKKADDEMESRFVSDSKKEGAQLAKAAKEFDGRLNQFNTQFDQKAEDFSRKAEDHFNAVRQGAMNTIDDFADEMQQDPKQALIEAGKMALMIIGAIALLKGIFRR